LLLAAAVLATVLLGALPPLTVVPTFAIDVVGVPALFAALLFGPAAGLVGLALLLPTSHAAYDVWIVGATVLGAAASGEIARRHVHPVWTWITWLALQAGAAIASSSEGGAALSSRVIDAMGELALAWGLVLAVGHRPDLYRWRRRSPPLAHLVFTTLAVFVAGLSLVTSLVYVRVSFGQLLAEAESDLQSRTLRASEMLGLLLDQRRSLVASIAQSLGTNEMRSGSPARLDAALSDFLKVNPAALSMLVADRSGRVIAAGGNRPWLNPRGIIGTDVTDRAYFAQPMRDGRPFVSNVFTGRGLGSDRLVAISALIPGPAGAPAGVVQMALDLSTVARVVSFAETTGLSTAVLDANGEYVVPFARDVRETLAERGTLPTADPARRVAVPTPSDPNSLVSEAVIGSTAWRVMSVRSLETMGQGIAEVARQALYIVLFGLLAALWLGRVAARQLVRPLASAAEPLRRPAGAPIGVHAVAQRAVPGEIRALLQRLQKSQVRQRVAFRQLARLRQDLDLKVAERTAELEVSRRQLASSAERWQQLLEISPDAIVTADGAGRVQFSNRAAHQLLGTASETLRGVDLDTLLPGWLAASAARAAAPTAAPRAPVAMRAVRRDGSSFPAEFAVAEMRNAADVLYVVVIRDQTVRQAADDELRRAKAEAESANAAKTMFLAVISHELRTPLNTILNSADLIGNAGSDVEREAYRGTLISSAESMLKVVGDLLDLSTIEAGKFTVRTAPTDLRAELTRAVDGFRVAAKAKGLDLQLQCEGIPEYVETDAARVAQIVRNLVGNALKFTAEGYVRVSARTERPTGGDARLLIEVADSGIGIPEEAQQRIFEPFVQQDGSISRAFGGTGLGLAISSRFAALLHGSLGLESRPGRGSTFTLRLPLVESSPSVFQQAAVTGRHAVPKPTRTSGRYGPGRSARPLRVLVVDDTEPNRRLAQRMLETMGHVVSTCASGPAALEALDREPHDVVLMDVSMPGIDGLETTRRLRTIERETARARAWIVGFTAHATPADADACRASGMDDVLTKPYRSRDLYDAIERAEVPGTGVVATEQSSVGP
jgi:PAS domain S-box-containing protein